MTKIETIANNLQALVLAYGQARDAVRAAATRGTYAKASADLWEAERALDEAAWQLAREGTPW